MDRYLFIDIDEGIIGQAKSALYNDFLPFENQIKKLYSDFQIKIGFGVLNYRQSNSIIPFLNF